MNGKTARERLWLFLVVRICTGQSSPRQFFRFWLIISCFAVLAVATGVLTVVRGDPNSVLDLAVFLLILAGTATLSGIGLADMRSPRTVDGRVTATRTVGGKGDAIYVTERGRAYADKHGRWSHRITVQEENGEERTFRATREHLWNVSTGDRVHARVGMRLRWIFDIEVTEPAPDRPGHTPGSSQAAPPTPEESAAQAEKDRELRERIEADPQAFLEELKRKQAETEAKLRRL